MCVDGRFFVTRYALARYIERFRPRGSVQAALSELKMLTSAGRLIGPYNGTGLRSRYPDARLELWRGPRIGTTGKQDRRSNFRFVVAYGPGDLPQVVTVLPTRGNKAGPRVASTRPGPMSRGDGRQNNNPRLAVCASGQELLCQS